MKKKIKLQTKIKQNNKKIKTKTGKKKKNIKVTILSILLIGGIFIISIILLFALYIIIFSPEFDKDKLYSKEASIIYYKNGEELTRFGVENIDLVNYDEMPQVLIDAFVATEDSRFFQHKGLDIARFAKASFGQLLGNSNAGGASTITMQVVKNTYTNRNAKGIQGIIRKFTDIYMAVFKVESCYTKEEILEFYTNSMWLCNDGSLNYNGISGVEQASKFLFGKSVSDISLAEASVLAGMYRNPRVLNPYTNPKAVKKRQITVLNLMQHHGYITEEVKNAVIDIPIESLVRESPKNNSNLNQAVIDFVQKEVEKETGLNPYNVPMKIYTTIDKNIQNVLNSLEKEEIYKFPNEKMQEGVAITSIKNGSIVALSGGRNYQAKGINRATDISRQPGSTAKPIFDYGPFIEHLNGSTFSQLLDERTTYSNGTSIKNADNKYLGLITTRTALVNSRNIPALRVFKKLEDEDINYIKDFAHNLGINYGKELFESASTGGFTGVSPLQMSAAYASFGRGGYYIKPYIYTKIELKDSGKIYEYKYEKKKVMSEETAYMITDMLITASEKHTAGGILVNGTDIAAKGGTTTIDRDMRHEKGLPDNATMDAWNITYSPTYSTALWIGYDRLSKEYYLNSSIGSSVRMKVMNAIGKRIYEKGHKFKKPKGVLQIEVEKETFPPQLPSAYTPQNFRIIELFKAGTEPTEQSKRFEKLDTPTNGNYTSKNNVITLTWDPISTPDAINNTLLQEHFNKYYDNVANKYYEKRLIYNNTYIGNVEYNIYSKNPDGTLKYLNKTQTNHIDIEQTDNNNQVFIVKASYSIFKSNESNGLEIPVKISHDPIEDIIHPHPNPDNKFHKIIGLE